jgi:hypothetical protein
LSEAAATHGCLASSIQDSTACDGAQAQAQEKNVNKMLLHVDE